MYSREFLLSLSSCSTLPNRNVRRRAYYLDIFNLNYIRKIKRNNKNNLSSDFCTPNNLNSPNLPNTANSFNTNPTLKPLCNNINNNNNNNNNKKINNLNIATLNIHSLNKKSLCIFDLVSANDLDLFLLTETWHESASSPSLLASTPQGFSFGETFPSSSIFSTLILWWHLSSLQVLLLCLPKFFY